MNIPCQDSATGSVVSPDALVPIAIVGIGCRFPGGANDPDSFWRILEEGRDAITDVPAERWSERQFYHRDRGKPGKSQAHCGGFLDDIAGFDSHFFGISPREAARMDPQQRLLLETAWEALEDAGQPLERLSGSNAAVFVGISSSDYSCQAMSFEDRGVIDPYSNTGGSHSIAANRISYCLDLRGPSSAVDTACSSALLAVHLACQSIWNDGCPMALAGGVNCLLLPDFFVAFSQLNMLSPDGRCKAFDADANGFVRSEGAGVVLLKRLDRAIADEDRIYAVIRGTASNQDGRTPGMTVPSQEAQERLIKAACRTAGVAPAQIQYMEAHGTGTLVGDPIEARALGSVLGADRPADKPCLVGSVKTNIGHLEAGAGIASLIKVALSIHQGRVPANLHFNRPNPEIDFDGLRLRVPVRGEPWPEGDGPRLAGINSFGYGGTNAHVIVQEPPREGASVRASESQQPDRASWRARSALVVLSARSSAALTDVARAMKDYVSASPPHVRLEDIAYSAAMRRTHHDHRIAVVANSKADLAGKLEALADGQPTQGAVVDRAAPGVRPKVAFVCSGQGPQWWAMGRQLLQSEPVFRDAIERCDAIVRPLGGWSLLDELTADEASSRMAETAISQPAIFALQVGLAEVWRLWGVEPSAVIGHSVGEVAAAYLAGVYRLEDAMRVIYERGRCMDLAASRGGMLAAGLTLDEAREVVSEFGERVTVAAVNAPASVTLSGEPDLLAAVAARLEQEQVFCRSLQVEYAFHSGQMDPVRDPLLEALQGIEGSRPNVPLFSTVTGGRVEGPELGPEYWWQNVRQTVRFADAVEHVADMGCDLAVELSPHPVLSSSVMECYQNAGRQVTIVPSLRRKEDERATMLHSLGVLHAIGHPVHWPGVVSRRPHLSLPRYPWQRERLWFESDESLRTRRQSPVHPLLGACQGGPSPAWGNRLDLRLQTYLADHRVQGTTVYPAAAYVDMALAGGREAFRQEVCRIEDLRLVNPCLLSPEGAQWLETRLGADDRTLSIHGRQIGEDVWTLLSRCTVRASEADTSPPQLPRDEIRARCHETFDRTRCYAFFERLGLHYGPAFRGIVEGWRRDGESLGLVELPDELDQPSEEYLFHPALLDACFQVVITADADFDDVVGPLYLPIEIERIQLYRQPSRRVWTHARLLQKTPTRMLAHLDIYDDQGRLVLQVQGLRSQRASGKTSDEQIEDLLYHYRWHPQPLVADGSTKSHEGNGYRVSPGHWLLFADRTGVADRLADTIEARGASCTVVVPGDGFAREAPGRYGINPADRDDMLRLVQMVMAEHPRCRGIVHLWNLDAPSADHVRPADLHAGLDAGLHSVLHLVQAWDAAAGSADSRLFVVTRGAQSVAENLPGKGDRHSSSCGRDRLKAQHTGASPPFPRGAESAERTEVAQGPVLGLGRVIASEYPRLPCKLVDLERGVDVDVDRLLDEVWAADEEDEVALRSSGRYVPRYMPYSPAPVRSSNGKLVPYRLAIGRPGTLDGLTFRALRRRAPAAGEVEIEVAAAALNFSDVMKALGLYPGLADGPVPLGAECSGVVTRVGDGVEGLKVGDEVLAVAPFAFGTHVTTQAELTALKPTRLSFEEAATIPIAFLTASYALEHLARLERGESVLIHSASGGVGLAAVQLARRAGARILATAGSEEKRQFLREHGIEDVMDSRSLAFADEVMERTGGRGVDAILNSLPGEAIERGMEILADFGRFLEIGKRDIYGNLRLGLRPFRNNLSFFGVDLDQVMRERPARLGRLLRELSREFEGGGLEPLPYRVFPATETVDAFRYMQQGKHIGKIVVSMQGASPPLARGNEEPIGFREDATYLITGGLGGFGMAVARWLVDRGARNLALLGRRGVHSPRAREAVGELESRGARVVVLRCDVTQGGDVRRALDTIASSLPPLRGIFHAAMVLEDGLLLNLDRDWMQRVMAPKIEGAWNLHQQTLDGELDYFVLFSSLSSMFGHAGQGNYAAANAFLDQLAHYRRACGLPAVTVNWGHLGEVGYLAERQQLGERLERQGILSFPVRQALGGLERALQEEVTQIGIMKMDWSRWRGTDVAGGVSPRFRHLLEDPQDIDGRGDEKAPSLSAVRAAPAADRPPLVEAMLREKVSRVLGIAPERLDGDTPLLNLGIDSLMAVELRNWIEAEMHVNLPIVQLMRSPSLSRVVEILCGHLAAESEGAGDAPELTSQARPRELLDRLGELTDGQVDDLLTKLLDEEAERAPHAGTAESRTP